MRRALVVALLLGCGSSRAEPPQPALAAPAPKPPTEVRSIAADELDVTHGAVDRAGDTLRITDAAVRASVPAADGEAVELRFVYAGPTPKRTALASGDVRHQVGLKLRAADGCNLIYVMWRLDEGVVVSIKRNPGDRTHAECGTGGYRNLRPERRVALTAPEVGSEHSLKASIVDGVLTASLDDRVVWRGRLGSMARGMHGPPGLRTDNVVLEKIEVRAAMAAKRLAGGE